MSKNTIFTLLAIIGGLVVAGWVLKAALHLLGPLLLIGGAVVIYLVWKDQKQIGGPK